MRQHVPHTLHLTFTTATDGAPQVARVVKNPPASAGDGGVVKHEGFTHGKIPWRRARQPTPVFLRGESQGQRSLAGYDRCSCKESDTTEVS